MCCGPACLFRMRGRPSDQFVRVGAQPDSRNRNGIAGASDATRPSWFSPKEPVGAIVEA
jgi:hypothetical protein